MLYHTIPNKEAYINTKAVKMCPFGASCASSGVAEVALKGSEAASCGLQVTTSLGCYFVYICGVSNVLSCAVSFLDNLSAGFPSAS